MSIHRVACRGRSTALLRIGLLAATFVMRGVCASPALPEAPDWTLDSASGQTLEYHAQTEGRPSVLVFWASWCPYCRALFPALETVRETYAARGVAFFALNVWEDADAQAYMRDHGYRMTLVLAADLVAEDYGVTGTPGVYVVDGQHRIRYTRERGAGPQDVAEAVSDVLDALLDENPP